MAYIDVDKFAEKICNFQAIDEDAANKMIWLLRTFPTADVVPKSEVERLEKENETLTINMNAYGLAAKRLAEEKSEVAREIFEEIEELAKINTFPVVKNGVAEIAKEPFWCIDPNDLAELKKKYTEEK